jgi:predicted nucleic acid-binding protein
VAKKLVLDDASISVQVINEVSVNLLKKLNLTEIQIEKFINSCFIHYDIINLSKEIFITASKLRIKYSISYYDSIIVSAALENNCTVLYSEDMQHEQIVENSLIIMNPFV